jgi:hypothetical protein
VANVDQENKCAAGNIGNKDLWLEESSQRTIRDRKSLVFSIGTNTSIIVCPEIFSRMALLKTIIRKGPRLEDCCPAPLWLLLKRSTWKFCTPDEERDDCTTVAGCT